MILQNCDITPTEISPEPKITFPERVEGHDGGKAMVGAITAGNPGKDGVGGGVDGTK
jgi:hypothetical protein